MPVRGEIATLTLIRIAWALNVEGGQLFLAIKTLRKDLDQAVAANY